ncbi:MAG: nitroreductase [Bacteroidales bacterium]|nr:nitroreductase [Bacteroidales bacterium]MBP3671461.1 nitroreductase family protein [Bacteroidaceae bacterium]
MERFLDLARRRQSDRAFDATRAIEPEKIARILEAAQLAPSACNAQPYKIIVVDEPELKNKVADTTSSKVLGMNHFTKQAPVHMIIVEENPNLTSGIGAVVKDKHFPYIDIGIVAAHITLAAADEGLGSCILGWFDEKKLRNLLDIPSRKRILLDIVIGYSSQPLRDKKRKDESKVIGHNKY